MTSRARPRLSRRNLSARVVSQEVIRTLPGPARALWTAAAIFCLAAWTAGCASGTSSSQPPARTDPAPSAPRSPAQPGDPQALARAAYLGMWQAYVAAARTAAYQAPTLDHYAAGGALTTLTQGLYQEHQQGNVTLGKPVLHPAVTLVKGSGGNVTQADVTDCADSSHWLNYNDGKPIADQDLRRRYIIARLQPFNGTWKVTYLNVGKAGTC
jgi:hypothetical protein